MTNRNRWSMDHCPHQVSARPMDHVRSNLNYLIVIRNVHLDLVVCFSSKERERDRCTTHTVSLSHSGSGVRKRVTEGEDNFTKTYPNLT